jgi:hypothetical protein
LTDKDNKNRDVPAIDTIQCTASQHRNSAGFYGRLLTGYHYLTFVRLLFFVFFDKLRLVPVFIFSPIYQTTLLMRQPYALWLLAIFYTLSLGSSCDDFTNIKRDELPAITTEGKNTFGCKVNGEVFRNFGRNFYFRDLKVRRNSAVLGDFSLHASQTTRMHGGESEITSIDFYSIFTTEGEHPFTEASMYADPSIFCDPNIIIFERDTASPASLNILRLDTVNFIIAGTFEFVLIHPECPGDTLRITEGRFDVEWR